MLIFVSTCFNLQLKELRYYKCYYKSYFCVCHKNRRKHSQHFKLLVFTINLRFVTSNQIPTYRETNFPLTSSIYLVFLPPEMQGRLKKDQRIPHVFLLCLKRNYPQTFKSGSSKNPFLQCVCY